MNSAQTGRRRNEPLTAGGRELGLKARPLLVLIRFRV